MLTSFSSIEDSAYLKLARSLKLTTDNKDGVAKLINYCPKEFTENTFFLDSRAQVAIISLGIFSCGIQFAACKYHFTVHVEGAEMHGHFSV
jgi:hypothetical protein